MPERLLRVFDHKTEVATIPVPPNAKVVISDDDTLTIVREGVTTIEGRTVFTPEVSPHAPEVDPESHDDTEEEAPTPAQEVAASEEKPKPARKRSVGRKTTAARKKVAARKKK